MMASIGLELRLADLRQALTHRAAFGAALLVNLLIFPLFTTLAAQLWGASPGVTAGLLLCAAAPGGATGPVFARLAGGHLAFATALMVCLGAIGLVTVPLTLTLALQGQLDVSGLAWPMFRTLALFQVLPLALAILARRLWPAMALRVARPARVLSNLALLVVVVGLILSRGPLLLSFGVHLHALLVLSLLLVLLPGLLLNRGAGLLRAASFITAVRNLSLALLLANRFLPAPESEVAVLVWGFWMMVLPGALGAWIGRREQAGASAPLDRHSS